MPISHHYDEESRVIHATGAGVITQSELMEYLQSVLDDDDIEPGFVEVCDFHEVEDLVVRYSQARSLQRIWKAYGEKGSLGTIVYAPTDLCYGICRMIQTVIGLGGEASAANFIVARTRAEQEHALLQVRGRTPSLPARR